MSEPRDTSDMQRELDRVALSDHGRRLVAIEKEHELVLSMLREILDRLDRIERRLEKLERARDPG